MSKYPLTILVLLTLAIFSNPALASKLNVEHWHTKNDVPVYFVNLPNLPMLDIRVALRAGAIHDGDLPGLARMTTSLIRTGIPGMDVFAITKAIEKTGAHIGFGADHNIINASFRSLTDKTRFDAALDIFLAILSSPTFPQDEIELNRKRSLQHIRTQNEKPGNILGRTFGETIYAGHVYSRPAIGYEESVKKIQQQDLRRFYETYFVSANMLIIGGGDVSTKAFRTIAERIAATLPPGETASPIPPLPPSKHLAQKIHKPFPSEQSHVRIGLITIDAYNPDRYALHIGNMILGSGFGSRLFEEIREKKGFAYSVYSGISPGFIPGPFAISFQTRADQTEEAIAVAMKVVEDFLENGPTDEEISLAHDQIKNGFAYSMISNGSLVGAVNNIALFGRELDYYDKYLSYFEGIDAKTVLAAFRKYIKPDEFIIVSVGQENNAEQDAPNL